MEAGQTVGNCEDWVDKRVESAYFIEEEIGINVFESAENKDSSGEVNASEDILREFPGKDTSTSQDEVKKEGSQDKRGQVPKGITVDDFVRNIESLKIKESPEDVLTEFMNVSESSEDEEKQDEINTECNRIMNHIFMFYREEQYKEILYQVVHTVGDRKECDQEVLVKYLKDAFAIPEDKHDKFLREALSRQPPKILLNVGILEAKDIVPTDINGLSDPFCTLYLTSDPLHRYNTSVKEQTLNPLWQEHFSIPVTDVSTDSLCLQVWDHDPEETVGDKLTNITKVAGVQGFVKLVEEIATSYKNTLGPEFVGHADIELKTIPVTGQTVWMKLEKQGCWRSRGLIKVKTTFTTQKDTEVAATEYKNLLLVFAVHEIETLKTLGGEKWSGQYSDAADCILHQLVVQNCMSVKDVALANWVAYAEINKSYPVSCDVMDSVLRRLVKPISEGLLTDEEVDSFWNAAQGIFASCLKTIKTLWKLPAIEDSNRTCGIDTLRLLSTLNSMQPPQRLDIFSQTEGNSIDPGSTVRSVVKHTVVQVAIDSYNHLIENMKPEDSSEHSSLLHNAEIVRHTKEGLEGVSPFVEKHFITTLQVSFAKTIYTALEGKIEESIKPLVKETCSKIKPLNHKEKLQLADKDEAAFELGRNLLKLYKEVQGLAKTDFDLGGLVDHVDFFRGVMIGLRGKSLATFGFSPFSPCQFPTSNPQAHTLSLGTAIFSSEFESLSISKFHSWFYPAVSHWFDVVKYDVMYHVGRAVDIDELDEPIYSNINRSSSAVETMTMHHQKIKLFWHQLAWKSPEESFVLLAKVLDDVCRCLEHYAEKVIDKLYKKIELQSGAKTFNVQKEWCLAMNNIDYLRQQIEPFAEDLGLCDIIRKMATSKGQTEAEERRTSLKLILKNQEDVLSENILHIQKKFVKMMGPSMRSLLLESADSENEKSYLKLMDYLDENLTTLNNQLTDKLFHDTLTMTFQKLLSLIYDVINTGTKEKRSPIFFGKLYKTLDELRVFYGRDQDFQNDNELLTKVERRLDILRTSTSDLIMQVHGLRLKDQKEMDKSPLGMLTVMLKFNEDTLHIDVLNGRNLKPLDSNGFSDPYVTIKFLPEDVFSNMETLKTNVKGKCLCPLFDETFTVKLTSAQRRTKAGMLLFMVKDNDFYRSNFMGEAYVPFSEIPVTQDEVEQTHLKLSVPSETSLGCDDTMDALHNRKEKIASEFIKHQKSKHDYGHVPT